MDEIREASVLRALSLMCDSWESDDISITEMTNHLEQACKVAEGTKDFQGFVKSANLQGRERLL